MNRRTFTKTALVGTVAITATTAFKCNGPRLDQEIAIAEIAINTLNVLVPSVAPLATKILKLLKDIDADAKAGKFDSAQAAFDNIGVFITQLQEDTGIAVSDRAKLIVVTILSAIRAIGLLVKQSMPPAARATFKASSVKALDAMTSPQAVDALFQSAKMHF